MSSFRTTQHQTSLPSGARIAVDVIEVLSDENCRTPSFGQVLNSELALNQGEVVILTTSWDSVRAEAEKSLPLLTTSPSVRAVLKYQAPWFATFTRQALQSSGNFPNEITLEDALSLFVQRAKLRREFSFIELTDPIKFSKSEMKMGGP